MKYTMIGIPPAYLDVEWSNVSDLIEKALEYADGKYNLDDIYHLIKSGEFLLCAIIDDNDKFISIQVLQFVKYPQKNVMIFVLVSNNDSFNYMYFMRHFKELARQNGAHSIECYGRMGWEKILIPYGFKKVHTYFSLQI